MKQYYLHDGQNQQGPFSAEELKDKNITSETFVWKEGMSDWVKAKEIDELRVLLVNTPPPFKVDKPSMPVQDIHKESGSYNTGKWIGRNWKVLTILFIVLAAVCIYNFSVTRNSSTTHDAMTDSISNIEKTPEELRMELEMKEKENPTEYLKASITRRKNLLGENVFEGTITNSASTATFKDISIRIIYLSKTRSKIGYHEFVVYEEIGPQQTASIQKAKFFPPKATDEYAYNVASAIPVNKK